MTRWNDTCQLVKRTFAIDNEGVQHPSTKTREVYCNSYTLSTQAWATARLADYEADDEIQVRTMEYSGEKDVVYKGRAYSVIAAMVQGDMTRLILKRERTDIGDESAEINRM